jgi:hypothetical protein
MTAPAIHYRISDELLSTFCDQVQYANKTEAEAAATALITGKGGPSVIYVYALAAKVSVTTATVDAT